MERLSTRTEQLLREREHAAPAGELAGRALAVKAFSRTPTGSDAEAAMYEASGGQWADARILDFVQKSPVAAIDSADFGAGGVALDFFAISGSALLSLPGTVSMQPGEALLVRENTHVDGVELPEGEAVPMSVGTYSRETLTPRRFVSLMEVFTTESLRSVPGSQAAYARSLAGGAGTALDRAFLSVASGGGLNGHTSETSGGSSEAQIRTNLRSMIAKAAAQGQDLSRSYWILAPTTAGHIAGLLTAGNTVGHPAFGLRGGELLGLPALIAVGAGTAPGVSPFAGVIALIDPAGVVRTPGAAEFRSSRSATVQMDTAPTNHSVTPTHTELVSMFQTNSVAMFGVIFAGFFVRPNAAVVMVTAY